MTTKRDHKKDNSGINKKESAKTKKLEVGNKKHIDDGYNLIIVVYMIDTDIGDGCLKTLVYSGHYSDDWPQNCSLYAIF